MFSLRRYATYVGLAVCILLTLSYFRRDVIAETRGRFFGDNPSLGSSPDVAADGEPSSGRFRWDTVPLHYSLPAARLATVPTATPKKLPQVQHSFAPETPEHASERKERRAAVKRTFERSWNAYKEHAWGHDELAPLSGGVKDGFGGWGATLVDNLDTLWMMGLKSEFEEAVKATFDLDLGKATTEKVNVFETTIRHLGGLLAAYELSGDKRVFEKAKEFGEMLIRAFDTPNHLPITRWKPQEALKGPQEADERILLAELGSLNMEFTRLSQVTGDPKWYDAVARITRLLDAQQDKTHLPGMWPIVVNAKNADLTQERLFSISAMSDSLYEYLPKMHALFGGIESVYKKLYEGSMASTIKYILWRPMTPDNADILMSGHVDVTSKGPIELSPHGQHLVCFAGGMFALGGKLFEYPAHVEIGKKLTDGCIWAYKAFPLGVMAESFEMVPCESRVDCTWDEQKWRDGIKSRHPEGDSVDQTIKEKRLPKGFITLFSTSYMLRPEAIESVFILYRITGEQYLQDAAWDMFRAITNATETHLANAALSDVTVSHEQLAEGTTGEPIQIDNMESFWMAETLKYFYLIFSEPDFFSLDEWVFNTEAHPFKRALL